MAKSSQIFSIFGTGNLVLSLLESHGFCFISRKRNVKTRQYFSGRVTSCALSLLSCFVLASQTGHPVYCKEQQVKTFLHNFAYIRAYRNSIRHASHIFFADRVMRFVYSQDNILGVIHVFFGPRYRISRGTNFF